MTLLEWPRVDAAKVRSLNRFITHGDQSPATHPGLASGKGTALGFRRSRLSIAHRSPGESGRSNKHALEAGPEGPHLSSSLDVFARPTPASSRAEAFPKGLARLGRHGRTRAKSAGVKITTRLVCRFRGFPGNPGTRREASPSRLRAAGEGCSPVGGPFTALANVLDSRCCLTMFPEKIRSRAELCARVSHRGALPRGVGNAGFPRDTCGFRWGSVVYLLEETEFVVTERLGCLLSCLVSSAWYQVHGVVGERAVAARKQ